MGLLMQVQDSVVAHDDAHRIRFSCVCIHVSLNVKGFYRWTKLKLVIFIFCYCCYRFIFWSTILSALLVTDPDGTSVHTFTLQSKREWEWEREKEKDKVAKEQTSNDACTCTLYSKQEKPLLVTTKRQICMQNIFDGGRKVLTIKLYIHNTLLYIPINWIRI